MNDPSWLDSGRYYLALLMWLTLPAAIVFWLIIHPFVGFWRRLGPRITYLLMALPLFAVGYLCWQLREPVLASRYPFRWWLAVVGLILYATAAFIEVKCRRYLKLRILVGVPELARDVPGRLLTEGIYAHTRNPRYLDMMIGLAGFSLILNYHGVYWLVLLTCLGLYPVVFLEERELRARFGEPYEEYCRTVPRFVPRSWAFLRA